MKPITVEIEYIGSCLSVNHCYVRNRKGQRVLRREAKQWRDILACLVRASEPLFHGDVEVILECVFKNRREACDPDNLAKLVLDGVANGLGINDRDIKFSAESPEYNTNALPILRIIIRGKDDETET